MSGFVSGIHSGDVALFYYSGHGVPYQAYPAGRVLEKLQGAGASLSILILDA